MPYEVRTKTLTRPLGHLIERLEDEQLARIRYDSVCADSRATVTAAAVGTIIGVELYSDGERLEGAWYCRHPEGLHDDCDLAIVRGAIPPLTAGGVATTPRCDAAAR